MNKEREAELKYWYSHPETKLDYRAKEMIATLQADLERVSKERDGVRHELKILLAGSDRLRAQVTQLRGVLEYISKTDICETTPDLIWLSNWRNNTKQFARDALASGEKENG